MGKPTMTGAMPLSAVSSHAEKREGGFTLIELLVVMVIIAILAVLAVASYRDAVVKSRRSTAKACLMEGAQFMERWYTTNLTYVGAPSPAAQPCITELGGLYNFSYFAVPTAITFTLQAIPTAGQNDPRCGTLRINNFGVRTETGTDSVADCW